MAAIQMQQSVNLGHTKVTHHKNQYSILSMQFLGKTCNKYMFLYNSISLFWHTTWRSANPSDYYETPVKVQRTFWVWRPASRPKYHCSREKLNKHKNPQTTKYPKPQQNTPKKSNCISLPHQRNKIPAQSHSIRKSPYSYKTQILHHLSRSNV